jgi:hypothetical protein
MDFITAIVESNTKLFYEILLERKYLAKELDNLDYKKHSNDYKFKKLKELL